VDGMGTYAIYCIADYTDINNVHIYESSSVGLGLVGEHIDVTGGTIESTVGTPIRVTGDNITVTGVDVIDSTYIFVLNAEDVKFVGCSIISGTSAGFYVKGSEGLKILDTDIKYNAGAGIYFYDAVSSGFIIANCDISKNTGDGIDIVWVCNNFTINNNIIRDNGGYGIDIDADAHDSYIIMGNNLLGNTNDNDDDGTGATKEVDHNLGTWV